MINQKLSKIVLFSVILILALYIQGEKELNNTTTAEEMSMNLSELHNATWNITQTFPYTNLYLEPPTVNNVLTNVIHSIMYPLLVNINTLIPISIKATIETSFFFKVMIWITILYIIILIPRMVVGIITLTFFIKEKKRTKTKIYE